MIRYIATLLLSLLFATVVNAQNAPTMAQSDSLFACGVELYNAGNYRKAIPLFAESDRIDKTLLDSTGNRCGYSAMWLAACLYHTGDSVTAAKVSPEYYRFKPVDRRLTVISDSLSDKGQDMAIVEGCAAESRKGGCGCGVSELYR